MWCSGPHCSVSKRFYTHSQQVRAGTIIPICGDRAKVASESGMESRLLTLGFRNGLPGTPFSVHAVSGTCCHQPTHHLQLPLSLVQLGRKVGGL